MVDRLNRLREPMLVNNLPSTKKYHPRIGVNRFQENILDQYDDFMKSHKEKRIPNLMRSKEGKI